MSLAIPLGQGLSDPFEEEAQAWPGGRFNGKIRSKYWPDYDFAEGCFSDGRRIDDVSKTYIFYMDTNLYIHIYKVQLASNSPIATSAVNQTRSNDLTGQHLRGGGEIVYRIYYSERYRENWTSVSTRLASLDA